MAEPHGPVLMGDSRQWNSIADEQVPGHQMGMHVQVLEQMFQLSDQTLVTLVIVRRVREDDVSVAVECDAVVRVWEVF